MATAAPTPDDDAFRFACLCGGDANSWEDREVSTLVACNKCGVWQHVRCVGLEPDQEQFFGAVCTSGAAAKRGVKRARAYRRKRKSKRAAVAPPESDDRRLEARLDALEAKVDKALVILEKMASQTHHREQHVVFIKKASEVSD